MFSLFLNACGCRCGDGVVAEEATRAPQFDILLPTSSGGRRHDCTRRRGESSPRKRGATPPTIWAERGRHPPHRAWQQPRTQGAQATARSHGAYVGDAESPTKSAQVGWSAALIATPTSYYSVVPGGSRKLLRLASLVLCFYLSNPHYQHFPPHPPRLPPRPSHSDPRGARRRAHAA